ncbi:hypothetical protein CBR_g63117 [Chara braunii]|uniref:Uncharacterized protein n=1 Tax=Chara braunii TaxID=69332 RepID=A0A388K8Y4_CHABU|nr:hypothetical protein CBR_g63117 [Chara braunii]|eukprot:GBG66534.1 hypothetical protein CBR_g63117 [Chara braunii]
MTKAYVLAALDMKEDDRLVDASIRDEIMMKKKVLIDLSNATSEFHSDLVHSAALDPAPSTGVADDGTVPTPLIGGGRADPHTPYVVVLAAAVGKGPPCSLAAGATPLVGVVAPVVAPLELAPADIAGGATTGVVAAAIVPVWAAVGIVEAVAANASAVVVASFAIAPHAVVVDGAHVVVVVSSVAAAVGRLADAVAQALVLAVVDAERACDVVAPSAFMRCRVADVATVAAPVGPIVAAFAVVPHGLAVSAHPGVVLAAVVPFGLAPAATGPASTVTVAFAVVRRGVAFVVVHRRGVVAFAVVHRRLADVVVLPASLEQVVAAFGVVPLGLAVCGRLGVVLPAIVR